MGADWKHYEDDGPLASKGGYKEVLYVTWSVSVRKPVTCWRASLLQAHTRRLNRHDIMLKIDEVECVHESVKLSQYVSCRYIIPLIWIIVVTCVLLLAYQQIDALHVVFEQK